MVRLVPIAVMPSHAELRRIETDTGRPLVHKACVLPGRTSPHLWYVRHALIQAGWTCITTDIQMPGMNGLALSDLIAEGQSKHALV